jgi:hypothetical protein
LKLWNHVSILSETVCMYKTIRHHIPNDHCLNTTMRTSALRWRIMPFCFWLMVVSAPKPLDSVCKIRCGRISLKVSGNSNFQPHWSIKQPSLHIIFHVPINPPTDFVKFNMGDSPIYMWLLPFLNKLDKLQRMVLLILCTALWGAIHSNIFSVCIRDMLQKHKTLHVVSDLITITSEL